MNAAEWADRLNDESWDASRQQYAKEVAMLAFIRQALYGEENVDWGLDYYWNRDDLFCVDVMLYEHHTDDAPVRKLEHRLRPLADCLFGDLLRIAVSGGRHEPPYSPEHRRLPSVL